MKKLIFVICSGITTNWYEFIMTSASARSNPISSTKHMIQKRCISLPHSKIIDIYSTNIGGTDLLDSLIVIAEL